MLHSISSAAYTMSTWKTSLIPLVADICVYKAIWAMKSASYIAELETDIQNLEIKGRCCLCQYKFNFPFLNCTIKVTWFAMGSISVFPFPRGCVHSNNPMWLQHFTLLNFNTVYTSMTKLRNQWFVILSKGFKHYYHSVGGYIIFQC